MTKLDELIAQQKEIKKQIDAESGAKEVEINVKKIDSEVENKYLILPFWDFAILSTLMLVFFPWSLLFCVFAYGLHETKLIVITLFHDLVKTFLAILSIVVPIAALIIFIFFSMYSK